MNSLLLLPLLLFAQGKDTILETSFTETDDLIVFTIKTKKQTEPKVEKWWYSGKYRIRFRDAKFAKNYSEKTKTDPYKKIKIENKYYDDLGAVFRLGFEVDKSKVEKDIKVIKKVGEVIFEIPKKALGIDKKVIPVAAMKALPDPDAPVILAPADSVPTTDMAVEVKPPAIITKPDVKPEVKTKPAVKPEDEPLKLKGSLGKEVRDNLKKNSGGGKGSDGSNFGTTMAVLAFLTILGAGSYYWMKKRKAGSEKGQSSNIELIDSKMIAPGMKVALIRVTDRILVVSMCGGHMELLTEFIPDETGPMDSGFSGDSSDDEDLDGSQESVRGILALREKFARKKVEDLSASNIEGSFNQAAGLESYRNKK